MNGQTKNWQAKNWQANSGRALGTNYKGDPRGCQDYAISWAGPRGALALACDGAGSSAKSQLASKQLAEAVSQYFQKDFEEIHIGSTAQLQKAIRPVLKQALQQLCTHYKSPLKDFHSTLLFVYQAFATNRYYSGHIGDGMIVAFTATGMEILSHSETGEGASNQTYFVDQIFLENMGRHFRTKIGEATGYIGYMCFSDGVEDYVHLRRKAVRDVYRNAGKTPLHPDLLAFFGSPAKTDLSKNMAKRWIEAGHTDDDCCLALIKEAQSSCSLDFQAEHAFYKEALELQRVSDRAQREEEERKRKEKEKQRKESPRPTPKPIPPRPAPKPTPPRPAPKPTPPIGPRPPYPPPIREPVGPPKRPKILSLTLKTIFWGRIFELTIDESLKVVTAEKNGHIEPGAKLLYATDRRRHHIAGPVGNITELKAILDRIAMEGSSKIQLEYKTKKGKEVTKSFILLSYKLVSN